MIQQSVNDCEGGCRALLKRYLRWTPCCWASLAGLAVCGLIPLPAFSQYTQPAQTIYGGGYPPRNLVAAAPPADTVQFANQSDQQLLAEARLFEQQGRAAQAQRIYLELQRRSLIRGQSQQVPTFNRSPAPFTPSSRPYQAALPLQSGQAPPPAAPAWTPTNTISQTADRDSFSLPTVQDEPADPTRSNAGPAGNAVQAANTVPAGPSSVTSGQQTPVFVLDRQVTPAPPQLEQSSGGWRAAVTPLPAALVQGEPTGNRSAEPATAPAAKPATEQTADFGQAAQPAPMATLTTQSTATPAIPAQLNATLPTAPPPNTISNSEASNLGALNQTAPKTVTPPAADAEQITPAHPLDLSRQVVVDSTKELPDIPALAAPDLPPASREPAQPQAPLRFEQEPAAFVAPAAVSERPLPVAANPEPPGVVNLPSAAPASLPLSPKSVPGPVPLQADQESSILDAVARLAKQTDDIRIIPGYRGAGRSRLEDLLSTGPEKESAKSDPGFDPPTTGWKSYMPSEPRAQSSTTAPNSVATEDARTEDERPRREAADERPLRPRHVRAESVAEAESDDAAESRHDGAPRSSQFEGEKPAEPKPAFNLSALLTDPEFREIHTRPVLDALELLSQAEPRHRLLGALRISTVGPDARTAMPALRQLLGEEPNKAVKLRIAEALLKLQPTDRSALETLLHLLVDPSDADLRQAAAGALGCAAASANATAIVRLTDALDDANPRVRIMAALSLAQFGPAAIDAVPRLETAATNDVPRMQRAALVALGAIRGRQALQDSAPLPSPIELHPTVAPRATVPAQNTHPTPKNINAAPPRPFAPEKELGQKPANGRPAVFPASQAAPAAPGNFESKAATVSGTAPPLLWPATPATRISLHEIELDGPSAEPRFPYPGEPLLLPEVTARPVEPTKEQPAPRPAAAPPKPVAPPKPAAPPAPPPLTDDSPLNLESVSGSAKAGASQ